MTTVAQYVVKFDFIKIKNYRKIIIDIQIFYLKL